MSKIEEAIAKRLLERADVGYRKYGVTMEREDLNFLDWLTHLQEELLDAAVYVEKLKGFAKENTTNSQASSGEQA